MTPKPFLRTLLLIAALTLLTAACGGERPTAPPDTAAPEPTTAPQSTPAPSLDQPTNTAPPPTPVLENPQYNQLSDEEQACLAAEAPTQAVGDPSTVLTLPGNQHTQQAILHCLLPESMDHLLTSEITAEAPDLTTTVLRCLNDDSVGTKARVLSRTPLPGIGAVLQAAAFTVANCLDPEEWALTGLPTQLHQANRCLTAQGHTTRQVMESTPAAHAEAQHRCGRVEPPPTVSPTSPTDPETHMPDPAHPLYAVLTEPEQTCLDNLTQGDPSLPLFILDHTIDTAATLRCLTPEGITKLLAHEITAHDPSLNPVVAACLDSHNIGIQVASTPLPKNQETQAGFLALLPARFALAQCVTPELWNALGHPASQQQVLKCTAEQGVTAHHLLHAALGTNADIMALLEEAYALCPPPITSPPPPANPADPVQHPLYEAAATTVMQFTGSQTPPSLIAATEYTWNNGSMGCGHPGQVYTEALIPGYVFTLIQDTRTIRVHSNERGTIMFVPEACIGGPTP